MHTQDLRENQSEAPVYHPLFTVGFVVLQACLVAAIPIVIGLRSPERFATQTLPSEAALWAPVGEKEAGQGN